MTNDEIRRDNARWLAEKCGGPKEFANKLDVSESRVSQLIGKTPTKNIGARTARKIESIFDTGPGWLDRPGAWRESADASATEIALVDASQIADLVLLFAQSTKDGRAQILRMAENAEKTITTSSRAPTALNQQ